MTSALQGTMFSTAGSSTKRTLLRQLGVQHVVGSRDTAFVEPLILCSGLAGGDVAPAVASSTRGQERQLGVEVVLNSLTSPGSWVIMSIYS